MPEQTITIREGLSKGLRLDAKNPRNTELFTVFQNLLPTEYGGKLFTRLTDGPGSNALVGTGSSGQPPAFSWPWPQLFVGKREIVLAINQEIYLPTYSVSPGWENHLKDSHEVVVKKALDTGSGYSIPSASGDDGIWQFVDLYDVWGLVRPNCTIFYNKVGATTGGGTDYVQGQGTNDAAYVTMRAACAHRGRGFAGGFDSAHFWSDDWKYIWRSWAHQTGYQIDFDFSDIDGGYVMWSSIGGGDLLFIFKADYAYDEGGVIPDGQHQASPAEPILLRNMKRNEAGFMPMPWQGNVQAMRGLGSAVVVYGEGGVSALVPSQAPDYGGYGLKHIWDHIGIYSRGAVGGNDRIHVFLDTFGTAYYMEADLVPKKIGYKEFFGSLTAPTVSYDEEEGYFYIGDNTRAYCLTKSGLCSLNQKIISVSHVAKQKVAVIDNLSGGNEGKAMLETDILDMGTRQMKVLAGVSIGGDLAASGDFKVTVDYRHDNDSSMSSSTQITANHEGYAPVEVSGVDFRIAIETTDYTKLNDLDYILVHWEPCDLRQPRGQYSAEASK